MPGGNPNRPQELPLGPNLRRFLDDPLGGEQLSLSLPFYDENIKLGPSGGGWFRNNNGDDAFHAATDFNTSPTAVFDVCAGAEGRVLALAGGRIVLAHTTPGGKEFRTVYVHLDLRTVSKSAGDFVRRGELLGRTDAATNPIHLHFGVAVLGPAFTRGRVNVPPLWYFIDPWGVYPREQLPTDDGSHIQVADSWCRTHGSVARPAGVQDDTDCAQYGRV